MPPTCDLFGSASRKKLAECKTSLDQKAESLRICNDKNIEATIALGKAIDRNKSLVTDMARLTVGPPDPADEDLRVVSASLEEELYIAEFSDAYPPGLTRFSDSNFWICQEHNIADYCAYMREIWLPIVKPYTIVEWTKINGEIVDICSVDCDNFAAFLKGITAIHGKWAGLAWGLQWGLCKGSMLNGYHALNTISSWEEPYNEETIIGLKLHTLEPQVMDTWEVELPLGIAKVGIAVDIIPRRAAGYSIKSMNLSIV